MYHQFFFFFFLCTVSFIGYSLHLHFRCYLLIPNPFPLPLSLPPWRGSLSQSPSPTSAPWHSLILGEWAFTGPKASPPTDDRKWYALLHMYLGPWFFPWKLIGWCFSLWELWWVWLVDNFVLPMGLQNLPASPVLSLAPSLGSPWPVWWLAASILLCIRMALAEPLRRHSYQVPAIKHYCIIIFSWV